MLHRRRRELVADAFKHRVASLAPGLRDTDLDQFVRGEVAIDLGQHLIGQAAVADQYDRVESMRAGAQRAALGG